MKRIKQMAALGVGLALFACTRSPVKQRADAMRPASAPPLTDDLPIESLREGARRQIQWLKSQTGKILTFGKLRFSAEEYAAKLEDFIAASEGLDHESLLSLVKSRFDFQEVYGDNRWGEILLTSYYEPEIAGSPRQTPLHSLPLLRTPTDLVEIAFGQFENRLEGFEPLRGRLSLEKNPRGTPQLVPYFTREEIESRTPKFVGLELGWVDPIDAFFLHIQGSGSVLFPDGRRLKVGYANQNGHKYEAIGRYLTDIIPKEEITSAKIERYLRGVSLESARKIMWKNPSYIFFKTLDGRPVTANNTEVVDGRTIATDGRFFPKGSLAYLSFPKPHFDQDAPEPTRWEETGRFVFDQDVGGAIKGTGRADLFWGSGPLAKKHAEVMKHPARLYYLVPKRNQ